MTMVSIPDAQANLPELLDNLKPGEEVILTRDEQPVAKLVASTVAGMQPVFGICRGKLEVVEEDEEHLDGFVIWTARE